MTALNPTAPEAWASIPNYPGYDASDLGRIRSWCKAIWTPQGPISGTRTTPRVLKPSFDGRYYRVRLRHRDGRYRSLNVGPLILETFVGPRPEGAVCCHHPDPNPANNRLENLRWDTSTANARDALEHKQFVGQKLTPEAIAEMWPRLVAGETAVSVAKDFGVTAATVCRIRAYSTWAHVTRTLPGVPPGSDVETPAGPVVAPREILEATEELWRPLVDWPRYRVSTRGRMLSIWPIGGECGPIPWDQARLLVPSVSPRGYARVCLTNDDGRRTTAYVHKLVLNAFAGPRPSKFVGCHRDGDKLNNHIRNLRWDSPSSNVIDNYRNGASGNTPLIPDDIRDIRAAFEAGETDAEIGERYKLTAWAIRNIRRRRVWKHVD